MKPLYKNVLYVDPLVVTHHRKLTAFILQMATMAQLGTQNVMYETSRDPFETLEMISRNKYDLIFVVDDQQNHINGITLGNLIKREITERELPSPSSSYTRHMRQKTQRAQCACHHLHHIVLIVSYISPLCLTLFNDRGWATCQIHRNKKSAVPIRLTQNKFRPQ